jgi:MYXO-CTERM domain-containing protein
VAATIGIQLDFILSAGDSVAITSYFQVDPVPAPAGLALLGLAGLGGRRRRRE